MLEAEGKLAAHLQIVMHDWPQEAKQNTIDHVLAALKEQRHDERMACAVAASTFEAGDPGPHETYADGRRAAAAKILARGA